MWLRDPIPIEVARVAVTPIGLQFVDQTTCVPLNISGFTFTCKVAIADGLSSTVTHPVTVDDVTNGEISISFDGRMYNAAGLQECVTLSYQVIATDELNTPVVALRGPIYLVPGI